ncbi:MAG TPA: hypothetical protein VFF06_29825 [Polyangia bacterium]|nr:hypothetical protein [Polyangia bacterium]
MQPIEVVVDPISTTLVIAALVASLAAVAFAWQFSRAIGGELGAAFKWVMLGTIVFALTRIDDVLKVSGAWARFGVDYKRVMWQPHSALVLLSWIAIAIGFLRMARTFKTE